MDAGVAAKWVTFEEHSEAARRIIAREHELLAPQHFAAEIGNIFRNKVLRKFLSAEEATELLTELLTAPIQLVDVLPLVPDAFEIAVRWERSHYDALYVALARRESCQLITADTALYRSMVTAFPETMLWVGDIP